MALMVLRNQTSATLMRILFTLLFPGWMSPLWPLIVANTNIHSVASFVRLIFLPQWILSFSTAQHYRALFLILLQVLVHSELSCGLWYHLSPTHNASMKVPALCSSSRVSSECYCCSWISTTKECSFILLEVSVRNTGLQGVSWIPEARFQPQPQMHHTVLYLISWVPGLKAGHLFPLFWLETNSKGHCANGWEPPNTQLRCVHGQPTTTRSCTNTQQLFPYLFPLHFLLAVHEQCWLV